MRSSYVIISISRSASIDAASSEISLFSSDYRRKRVCTAQPCCCMTNRLRCALLLCHKTHMAHPSDTAMHARRLRVDSESSCSTSCGSTDSIKSHRHSISLKRTDQYCSRCVLSLSTDIGWVYTAQILDHAKPQTRLWCRVLLLDTLEAQS